MAVGATATHREVVSFFTYFNESVEGLDVGAPVSFRGVKVGSVGAITIALDRRMVEVRADIDADAVERLGILPKGKLKRGAPPVPPPPDLRTQLGSQGLTGNRYVAVDFFDPVTNPPPQLSFQPQERYVPAARSLSKGLEDSVTKAADRLAELADVTLTVMRRVDAIVADLERGHAGEVAVDILRRSASAVGELDRVLRGLNRAKLPENANATLDAVRMAIDKFDNVLESLEGSNGLVAVTRHSVAAFGNVGQNLDGATRDLNQMLGEIREAASAVRWLADELERQPDVLVKGRATGSAR